MKRITKPATNPQTKIYHRGAIFESVESYLYEDLVASPACSFIAFRLHILQGVINQKLQLRNLLGGKSKLVDNSLLSIKLVSKELGDLVFDYTKAGLAYFYVLSGSLEVSKKFFIKDVLGNTKNSFLKSQYLKKHQDKLYKLLRKTSKNLCKRIKLAQLGPGKIFINEGDFECYVSSESSAIISFGQEEYLSLNNQFFEEHLKNEIDKANIEYECEVSNLLEQFLRNIRSRNVSPEKINKVHGGGYDLKLPRIPNGGRRHSMAPFFCNPRRSTLCKIDILE